MSVDARTSGRRLDGYRRQRLGDGLDVLVDPDLHRLPVEITVVAAGLLRRGLGADVQGLDGAPCPIEIVR